MVSRISSGPILPVPSSAGANAALRIVVGGRDTGGDRNKPLAEVASLPVGKRSAETAAGARPSATSPVVGAPRSAAARPMDIVDPGLLTVVQGITQSANTEDPGRLTLEEQRTVEDMRRRDSTVRQEEQTQAAQAGQFAGAPIYEYQVGPDNKRYAVAGEVPVSIPDPSSDPATLERALDVLSQAATSPAATSAQEFMAAQQAAGQAARVDTESVDSQMKAVAQGNLKNTGRLFDITS